MNSTTIKGNWNIITGKLKQKYATLTDDDLTYLEGKEDEMVGRIQKKVGKSKDEIRDYINELTKD
ncbi:MAG: CsbD family protein [Verrucomicrobiota bacterium]|nr:CsbD family protein [Verrucomicrobiota bacterium]